MFKHKNALAALMAVVMLFTLTACGKKAETPAQNEQPAEAPAESDMTEWEQSSGIYNTDETDEEMYQQALEEGATVTLYSTPRPLYTSDAADHLPCVDLGGRRIT